MSEFNYKRKRSRKETVGFYTALSICMIAVGMAAYSTYTSLSRNSAKTKTAATEAVNRVVEGVTAEPTEPATEKPTETEPPTEEEETYVEETAPAETKTPLRTMLTVNTSLSYPLDSAKVISQYSEESVYNKTLNQWNAHTGVDFACEKGDNVYSMGEGTVVRVYNDDLLGRTVVIKSATYTAFYSGLEKQTKVQKGDEVRTGDIIGTAGVVPSESMSPTHIHIAVKVDGQYTDPMTLINSNE